MFPEEEIDLGKQNIETPMRKGIFDYGVNGASIYWGDVFLQDKGFRGVRETKFIAYENRLAAVETIW